MAPFTQFTNESESLENTDTCNKEHGTAPDRKKKDGLRIKRKTVSLHPEIEKRIREIQSGLIGGATGQHWSFSKVVNVVLLQGLLNSKGSNIDQINTINEYLSNKNVAIPKECRNLLSSSIARSVYTIGCNYK